MLKSFNGLNKKEQDWIILNIIPPQYPLTINNLNQRMSNIFGQKERKRDIKKFLKENMRYSYKKGSSMLKQGFSNRNLMQQSIFSSRVLLDILKGKYLINIDEASF